jgi:hypothetical protein
MLQGFGLYVRVRGGGNSFYEISVWLDVPDGRHFTTIRTKNIVPSVEVLLLGRIEVLVSVSRSVKLSLCFNLSELIRGGGIIPHILNLSTKQR